MIIRIAVAIVLAVIILIFLAIVFYILCRAINSAMDERDERSNRNGKY